MHEFQRVRSATSEMSARTARSAWSAALILTVALATVPVAACGSSGSGNDAAADPTPTSAPVTGTQFPQGSEPVVLDPSSFTADIDNPYWPMTPGTRWTYREVDDDGLELRVVITVSSETRVIANGVTARVVRDSVTLDGELIEDTLDFYAQDAAGNIWYLGEDTAEFEDGQVATTAGSFEAGVDGALPGVMLPADPAPGMQYRQEYYAGEAEDNGEILRLDGTAEVPYGNYENVLVTRDTITIEPDVEEHKFYAPGVGPVLTIDVAGGGAREELVDMTTVSYEAARLAGTTPLGEPYP